MKPHKLKAIEIQSKHHRLVLDYRAQDRMIQSDLFREAWNSVDEDERRFILNIFSNPNPYKLKRWVLKMTVKGLEQYPISTLRQIASYYKIINYSRMSRAQLINILTKKGVTDGSKNVQRDNK